MSTYYANDKYNAVLTAGYSVGQTTLYVSAVPNHVPTIIVAAKGTDKETVFAVTDKTTNSLTGVSRLRGANVDLDAQTPLTCLNNEEFINQLASVSAVFNEEHDETGKHTKVTIRVGSADSSATPSIDTDEYEVYRITALATNITSFTTNLSGTPSDGQRLTITIKDNGTARTIAWGNSFASRGATLPTTTVASKLLSVGLIYNSATSTWDCVAVSLES